jgi:hypothetical protein
MYFMSTEMQATLRFAHRVHTKLVVRDIMGNVLHTFEAYDKRTTGGVSFATVPDEQPVFEGYIRVDRNSPERRRATINIVTSRGDLIPSEIDDLFMPWGNEMIVYRGVRVLELSGGERIEYVPLGIFGITDFTARDSGQGWWLQVEGSDRSEKIANARLTGKYEIAKNTNAVDAIRDLIDYRSPSGIIYAKHFAATDIELPKMVIDEEANPWDKCTEIAESIGMDLYFDNDGLLVLRPEPDPDNTAVCWEYSEDQVGMTLDMTRRVSRRETYNHVIVAGEPVSNTEPARGEAFDDNPSSPTYYQGTFGDRPYFIVSSAVATDAQAEAMANAILNKQKGLSERLTIQALVNPAHEVGDVVLIQRERIKINAKYVMDSFTIPLQAGSSMSSTMRKRQIIS